MTDLAELKRLARQATPGPWVSCPAYGEYGAEVAQANQSCPRRICQEIPGYEHLRLDEGFLADFNYIAAANPAATVALLTALAEERRGRKVAGTAFEFVTRDLGLGHLRNACAPAETWRATYRTEARLSLEKEDPCDS